MIYVSTQEYFLSLQVRSMFGNNENTSTDLMLPILFDMANLIRRAVRSGKEPREVKQPPQLPKAQMQRRSFTEDTYFDDDPFETGIDNIESTTKQTTTTNKPSTTRAQQRRRVWPQRAERTRNTSTIPEQIKTDTDKHEHQNTQVNTEPITETDSEPETRENTTIVDNEVDEEVSEVIKTNFYLKLMY